MGEKQPKRPQDELEQQEGGTLPKREVMSILSTSPGLISIPEDPLVDAPEPKGEDELVPPPSHDV